MKQLPLFLLKIALFSIFAYIMYFLLVVSSSAGTSLGHQHNIFLHFEISYCDSETPQQISPTIPRNYILFNVSVYNMLNILKPISFCDAISQRVKVKKQVIKFR